MTTISIYRDSEAPSASAFRAVVGNLHSSGRSPGEALDAMTKQLNDEESGTMVVIQQFKPDRFFTAEQQKRLKELMGAWREARDSSRAFPPEEQAELERLIEEELDGSARRTAAMLAKSRA